jgi:hypothetical protein
MLATSAAGVRKVKRPHMVMLSVVAGEVATYRRAVSDGSAPAKLRPTFQSASERRATQENITPPFAVRLLTFEAT